MNDMLTRVPSNDLFGAQYGTAVSQPFQDLSSQVVTAIRAVTVNYCFNGRNAWHSTWITQYSSGCMHRTLDSAKEFAETNRVQGSKFYIKELPAISLDTMCGSVVVTEINTPNPLSQYSVAGHTWANDPRLRSLGPCSGSFPQVGQQVLTGMLSLQPGSRHWPIGKSSVNSVITLFSDSGTPLNSLKTHKLTSWRSSSRGPGSYLSWWPMTERASGAAVLALREAMVEDRDGA